MNATRTAFTPGPWTLAEQRSRQPKYALRPTGYAIVGGGTEPETLAEVWDTRHERALTNARLIAAAPALYEACRAFVTAYQKSHQLEKTDVALRAAIAAIAQVEGTTP